MAPVTDLVRGSLKDLAHIYRRPLLHLLLLSLISSLIDNPIV